MFKKGKFEYIFNMITSVKNDFIKEINKIKKNQGKGGLIFLEGERIVFDSILGGMEAEYFIVSESYQKTLDTDKKIIVVSNPVFKSISDTKTPQGIGAVIRKPPINGLDKLFERSPENIFLLDRIQDPGNFGTIVRSADAFGTRNIICRKGTVDPYNPKVIRATMGSIFRVSIFQTEINETNLNIFKEIGYTIYGAVVDGGQDLSKIKFTKRNLIIIGNEANGISEDLLKEIDTGLTIEMNGSQESLNAAVAASIIMYKVSI